MIALLKRYWKAYRMSAKANHLGWLSLGDMIRNHNTWTEQELNRKIRRSNRLYRLANGKSPWKKLGNF